MRAQGQRYIDAFRDKLTAADLPRETTREIDGVLRREGVCAADKLFTRELLAAAEGICAKAAKDAAGTPVDATDLFTSGAIHHMRIDQKNCPLKELMWCGWWDKNTRGKIGEITLVGIGDLSSVAPAREPDDPYDFTIHSHVTNRETLGASIQDAWLAARDHNDLGRGDIVIDKDCKTAVLIVPCHHPQRLF